MSNDLTTLRVAELRTLAASAGIRGRSTMTRPQLIDALSGSVPADVAPTPVAVPADVVPPDAVPTVVHLGPKRKPSIRRRRAGYGRKWI
jgi:hypothetical protein